jgi:hypothetical protein
MVSNSRSSSNRDINIVDLVGLGLGRNAKSLFTLPQNLRSTSTTDTPTERPHLDPVVLEGSVVMVTLIHIRQIYLSVPVLIKRSILPSISASPAHDRFPPVNVNAKSLTLHSSADTYRAMPKLYTYPFDPL